MKLPFECDYSNGAHPLVLQHLVETNAEPSLTYGFDRWSDAAKEKISKACRSDKLDIFFLQGGTQANAVVIDSLIRSHEGVVCADTGHVNVHEAGAVEANGHCVIDIRNDLGKLSAKDLEAYLQAFYEDESRDHLPQPGMVYITFPTELGTCYTASELSSLYDVCRRHGLPLFIDGARLAYGLAASSDIDLPWLTQHCDAFTIGGTKCGALCGEAVVFTRHDVTTPRGFFSNVKRHGALSAKGRLAGVQFDALFSKAPDTGNLLYLDIGKHAVSMAKRLKQLIHEAGLTFFIPSDTNQQFVIIPNDQVKLLEQSVCFTHWQPYDNRRMVCRFVTSWSTTDSDMQLLEQQLQRLHA